MSVRNLLNLMSDRLHTLPLVVLYLTDGCNSRCVTCDIWRNPRRNMKMDVVDTVVDAIEPLHMRWLLLSGGEAMQHPEWPTIARRFRDRGVHVMLLTNGLLLRRQLDDVVTSVDEVIVSLDGGTAATYEAIRGVDAFDLIVDGMRAVSARGVPVSTRTTVQRGNFRDIPLIIEAARQAGAQRVSFLPVDVSSGVAFGPRFPDHSSPRDESLAPGHDPMRTAPGADDVPVFAQVIEDVIERYGTEFDGGLIAESPDKLRRLVDYFKALHGMSHFEPPRCNAPHISTVIEVDGRLRPCYFLPDAGKLSPGKTTLGEAVNIPLAMELRRAYRSGQRPECARCVCPLYKGPRALMGM